MKATPTPINLEIVTGEVTLRGDDAGEGFPLVLLHGLSATRRNVLQGSRHLIRRGYRVIGCDARGHGASSPAPDPAAYEYADLIEDLEATVEELGLHRAALVGSSMGAAVATAFALAQPERVPALVLITPAYTGTRTTEIELEVWNRMAAALERGIDEFVAAATPEDMPERWREAATRATRQRMQRHEHPQAVAAAMRVVPRSTAFEGLERLAELEMPCLVVGSRDEADAIHRLAVAREYVERLPRGELIVEDEDESPLAWRGAALSRAIGDFLERSDLSPQL